MLRRQRKRGCFLHWMGEPIMKLVLAKSAATKSLVEKIRRLLRVRR